jgi:phosphoglycerate dehydrogenase-like enzyme
MVRIAVLDDYQQVAMSIGKWSALPADTQVDAFQDHLFDEGALAARLRDYDVVIGMRERTPMPRSLLEQLPNLKLLITTGMGNASFDFPAATDLGIVCCGTGMGGPATAELAWGLILALTKHIPQEDAGVRAGRWQLGLTESINGKTLGIVGLGRLTARHDHREGRPRLRHESAGLEPEPDPGASRRDGRDVRHEG